MEGIFKDFIDYRLNWHLKCHVLCLTRLNRTYEHTTNAKYAGRGLAMVELSFIFCSLMDLLRIKPIPKGLL